MGAWWAANWTEVLGFVSGAACVFLAARRSIWNYPVGIVNTLTFLVLFGGAALYADAGLQVVYLALAVHGWIGWARGRRDEGDFVRRTPPRAVPVLVLAGAAITAVLVLVLSRTDSTTVLADAATTGGSLVAQYMLNRRWTANWFVWIAVDVAYVGLYAVKGLWITAVLYVLFIGLCVDGLRSWRRLAAAAPAAPRPGALADA